MSSVDSVVSEIAALAALPADQARLMPTAAYTDPAIFDLERDRIFAREWLCVGRADAIPQAGDYLTYRAGAQPLAVVRQRDGTLRAFANVCLHRMMILLPDASPEPANCDWIACPYHGWTYDLEGRLVGAPQMRHRPGFDKKALRLPEIALTEWQGWIFVCLADEPPDLHARLAPLTAAVAPYRAEGYVQVAIQDHLWQTNWKLLAENFMESYHLPVAHRETVGAWTPVDKVDFPHPPHLSYTCQTFPKDPDARYGVAAAGNTHLEGALRHTAIMPTVFPAHMFVLAPDHLWWLSLMPEAVDRVHVRFGASIAPERLEALNDAEAFLAETVAFFDKVNAEDRQLVESIHRGVSAPLSRPGPLSWLERSLHDFQGYLAAGLTSDGVPGRAAPGG